ncbi:di-trans,poly-cis-decaprenylcistransferase [Buchnera aphidicola (Aphis helianthi)]|uniref:Ditrans,polycis-undecaprenyl-diphosphate synthase ((2E,6E)-farnesyl-diphosphate specific) n=1 Tax=Buchnera aphidicola (Aphis helianthi) TaxID=2315802 RepID=A0A4D6XKN0_9GAMM|nr:polyprenyl diphosphate synthase [Buchnera aphidicola]QCI17063.1 di-trans,poly-cis-decaprenylcistransferase [Buchnera aphidicola (Aphis helianthi)]
MLCKYLQPKTTLRKKIPRHIAIIMDGNGRWAQKKGKIRTLGHKAGFKAVKEAIKFAIQNKIEVLTLYTFSSENWKRPKLEVVSLIKLFLFALKNELKYLNKYNICLKVIGDLTFFSEELQSCIYQAEKITLNNSGLILNIAANYGGKWDIVQGVKKIITAVHNGDLNINQIEEKTFSQYLSTSSLLPVDLVIRTGGEKRLSNFLLWQIAYSELYFTDVLWPDFNRFVFQDAMSYFSTRNRRFGGLIKD